MTVTPYVFFPGTCAEAIEFYRGAVGAEVAMMSHYKDCPDPKMVGPGLAEKVMHVTMKIGKSTVMASDQGDPDRTLAQPDGFSLAIAVPTAAEAERAFANLSAGGTVKMPLSKTFWAELFGMVVDRFGIEWMVMVGE